MKNPKCPKQKINERRKAMTNQENITLETIYNEQQKIVMLLTDGLLKFTQSLNGLYDLFEVFGDRLRVIENTQTSLQSGMREIQNQNKTNQLISITERLHGDLQQIKADLASRNTRRL